MGGGISIVGDYCTIKNVTLSNNTATKYGGAIYIFGSNALIENTITFNNTAYNGGSIYINDKFSTIKNTTFLNNTAKNLKDGTAGYGGGIFVNSTSSDIQGKFYYNKARNGSAIYVNSTGLKVHDSIFDKNQAWSYILSINVTPQEIFSGGYSNVTVRIKGGDNIANAIYNAAGINSILINNITYLFRGFDDITNIVSTPSYYLNPKNGPINDTSSVTGVYLPYQYDWEDNQIININIINNKTGEIAITESFLTNSEGYVYLNASNLKIGKYEVFAFHPEDNYYTEINNKSFIIVKGLDLSITKTVSNQGPINIGENIIWTITVYNDGTANANGVYVNDTLPNGLTYVSDDSGGDYNPTTGIWTIGTLANGTNVTLKIITTTNKAGSITNFALVNSSITENNTKNNKANATTTVISTSVDLVITKAVDHLFCVVGDNVVWTVSVTNKGPGNASDVFVKDVLPDGLKYVSHTVSVGAYDHVSGLWTIGALNNGQSVVLTMVTSVLKLGNLTNIVTVNTTSNDTNKSNNKANKTIKVNPIVDLKITKYSNKKIYYIGNKVIWTIKIINNGPCKAVDAYVVDKLPLGFKYISSSASKGSYNKNTGKWNIGNMSKGEKVILKIITKAVMIGNYTNIASINNTVNDTNSSNNEDNFTVKVIKKEIPPIPSKHDNHTNPVIHKDPNNTSTILESTGNPLIMIVG